MKFTVVITTYNRLNLLKRAIDSAFNQTIPCEVVVVDDCSLDDTQEYVMQLRETKAKQGDNRLIYHRNPENKGHAATVNVGVELSSGEWIKFLDDDDYLADNCLEQIAIAVSLHPQAVITSCIAAQVDENQVELNYTPKLGACKAFYVPQADIHYGMLLELLPFGTPVQVACRRDVFLKTGGWDSKLDANCDDIDSWIRIAQHGDALFLNQCLAYRTIWSGAYNHKFSLSYRLKTNILMKEKIYQFVDKQHHSKIRNFQNIKNYLKLHWALVALKQKNIKSLWEMLDYALLSPISWWLLLQALLSRKANLNNTKIRKFILID
jgi:glycosyltransferase involved in cell wall biosynthesis